MANSIIILSVVLQAIAVYLALRIAWTTRRHEWLLLSLAILLMGVRRAYTLYRALAFGYTIDPGAESIALLISILLLLGMVGLQRRFGQRPDAGTGAGETEVSSPVSLQRLTRTAIILGTLIILGSCAIGYYAYLASRDTIMQNVFENNLNLARTIGKYADLYGRSSPKAGTLRELQRLWEGTKKRYPGSYLCVVNAPGKLTLHTARPETVGNDVGKNRIQPRHSGDPKNLRELLEARQDWAGLYISSAGQKQVAAFAYINSLNALAAVHVPTKEIEAEIRATTLPWAVGFALITGVLLPLSLGLLHWAYSYSQRTADCAQMELRETASRFSAITGAAADAIVLIDNQGNISYWNPAAERIFGYTSQEAMGKELSFIIPQRDKEAYRRGFNEFKETGQGPNVGKMVELSALKRDGTEFPVDLSISAIRLKGRWHAAGIIRDITERKRLESQLMHSQKMEAVGLLAGGVAHDFNNLLTAILGYGSMLEMKLNKDDPLRNYAAQVVASAERAATLTKGLLAFSRKQIISPKRVKVNEIIESMQRLLSRLICEDIEFRIILSDKDLVVMADSAQIEQVLMNLATNACDAMPDGGLLTISTELAEMDSEYIKRHGYGEPGRYALISITDTGAGMDEETRERIFEPFFTTKELGKGTGLGLSIVYGIIKQHNGYINVYSELGKGTTFKIYLPTIEFEAEEKKATELTPATGGRETVLVAEDEAAVRELTKAILQESGYAVIEAVDGEDAIEKFKENRERIRLLILDVVMPKKNGKEVYDDIKGMKPDVKALLMSGYPGDVIHKKGILEEDLHFISKPVSPDGILRKVREALDS